MYVAGLPAPRLEFALSVPEPWLWLTADTFSVRVAPAARVTSTGPNGMHTHSAAAQLADPDTIAVDPSQISAEMSAPPPAPLIAVAHPLTSQRPGPVNCAADTPS